MKELLELRKIEKARKPKFIRKDSNTLKGKTRTKWRKPRGLHNKRRLNKKGHQKNPSVGYKSPVLVRGLQRSGLSLYYLRNINDFKDLNKESHQAIIASNVGLKNKIKILEKCLADDISVSNIKDLKSFLEDVKTNLAKRKDTSKGRKTKRKKEEDKATKKKEDKKDKQDEEKKQDDVKKEVMSAKQDKKTSHKGIDVKKDTTKAKSGHLARSVPGTKQ